MKTKIHENNIVEIVAEGIIINNVDNFLELFFENDYSAIILKKENMVADFFSLSTGIAGDILQKALNYHIRMAIVGDFEKTESQSLKAFIVESNRAKQIIFVKAVEEALKIFNSARGEKW